MEGPHGWLSKISWDQLERWVDFFDKEPHGEERDDLRIGALASVIWNCNIDTKAIGGPLQPLSYLSGWNGDRVSFLALKPKKLEQDQVGSSAGNAGNIGSGKLNLNDPIGWENFTTGLRKFHKVMNG